MKIRNIRAVKQFMLKVPASRAGLTHFLEKARTSNLGSVVDVKEVFPGADYLGKNKWIFNISGNNCRLVAMVWLNHEVLYVLKVMTHRDYDKEKF